MTATARENAAPKPRGRRPKSIADPRPAKQRLLDAASELFYAEGVQSVGIDRVLERADVAKGSLYSSYGSKEALVEAYLDRRHDGTVSRITAAVERFEDPRERLLAVFDAQGQIFKESDFHGCAFVAAGAEAKPGDPISHAVDDYRAWVLDLFVGLARAAGVRRPAVLAQQLQLIYDGGGLAANLDRNPAVAKDAKAAAEALLDAALAAS